MTSEARFIRADRLQTLRGNVSVLEGSGGNIAVLTGPDGKLLVDAGITASRPRLPRPWRVSAPIRSSI
jgi:hypothetical protein